jgi:hypothetical protein
LILKTRYSLAPLLLAVGMLTLGAENPDNPEREPLLLGNWICESGACPDEEIQFTVEKGRRVYHSWLHQRPSAVNGGWQLEGDVLMVECCGGVRFEWVVVEVGEKELRLREEVGSEEVVFSRVEESRGQ